MILCASAAEARVVKVDEVGGDGAVEVGVGGEDVETLEHGRRELGEGGFFELDGAFARLESRLLLGRQVTGAAQPASSRCCAASPRPITGSR